MNKNLFPPEFIERLKKKLGVDFDSFCDAHENIPPVSIRVNPFKKISSFNNCEKVSWATGAYYLPERISFTLDPLFHAGCYYVQEASSMLLEKAFGVAFADGEEFRILDLCAAPGGKSTHIASLMPESSLLVSNEVIPSRNKILQQNISKWGTSNVVVTQNDATDFQRIPAYFDVIVVDAPCSGEGLFRKEPDAVNEWSIDAVQLCSSRQTSILQQVIASLKKGGYLIYSTCTFEGSENDNQIEKLISDSGFEHVEIPGVDPQVVETKWGMQCYPHKVKGEGFYISLLRKTSGNDDHSNLPKLKSNKDEKHDLKTYLEINNEFVAYQKNDELYALPLKRVSDIRFLMDNLFVRKAGIHIGTLKGKDLVPSPELALSIDRSKTLPSISLNREEAISFLRCETFVVADAARGWLLVTYEGFALGWIKSLGNRINNYYPREWRILSQKI